MRGAACGGSRSNKSSRVDVGRAVVAAGWAGSGPVLQERASGSASCWAGVPIRVGSGLRDVAARRAGPRRMRHTLSHGRLAHRPDRGALNRPWTRAMRKATMAATRVRRVRPPADTGGGGSRPLHTRSDTLICASKHCLFAGPYRGSAGIKYLLSSTRDGNRC